MLNPKLMEIYGENSSLFFDEFISKLGDEVASICKVPADDYGLVFGDLSAPNTIHVYTVDTDLYWKITNVCLGICCDMQNTPERVNKDDMMTMCVQYKDYKLGDIDIWVK